MPRPLREMTTNCLLAVIRWLTNAMKSGDKRFTLAEGFAKMDEVEREILARLKKVGNKRTTYRTEAYKEGMRLKAKLLPEQPKAKKAKADGGRLVIHSGAQPASPDASDQALMDALGL